MFGSKKWSFHCLDISLAKEWMSTCDEYLQYVRRPFSSIPADQLWKCEQSNWSEAYKEWSVLQFWLGVIVAVIVAATRYVDHKHFITTAINVATRIAVAFVLAHLSWFSVSKKRGCFCCLVACCQCPPILLIWGFVDMLWGAWGVLDAFHDLDTSCKIQCPPILLIWGFVDMLWGAWGVLDAFHDLDTSCKMCFILPVMQAAYSIILFYMGLSCWKLWVREDYEVLPDKMEMRGPQGERLTAAST
eukprot:CAMPEP_0194782454 /NCGR_PEP_ID=MMETSP0323_2-20130528/78695_1 /TAXON_ID=2866 ORGANISM="Crypthecodinium cohnii, Strain Seligo" /NCGR_SAMPLE_ID=MMETSP0323_2 /ASSEMBLY_ACC=CAM_ASM_000346 /LENGTH=244 /DNA_ID=CAMNT_0039721263 /DNA_START=74 /DNA_END=808 /DNA_ORIENTATION=+